MKELTICKIENYLNEEFNYKLVESLLTRLREGYDGKKKEKKKRISSHGGS